MTVPFRRAQCRQKVMHMDRHRRIESSEIPVRLSHITSRHNCRLVRCIMSSDNWHSPRWYTPIHVQCICEWIPQDGGVVYACTRVPEMANPHFWITTLSQPATSLHVNDTSKEETGYLASPSYCCRGVWPPTVKNHHGTGAQWCVLKIALRWLEPSPELENLVAVMEEPFPVLTFLSFLLRGEPTKRIWSFPILHRDWNTYN